MFYANIARKYNIANALAEATMSKNMNMAASFVDDIVNQVHKVVFPLGLMSVSCRKTVRSQAIC